MELLSKSFGQNDFLPYRFSLEGRNVSPSLIFRDIPQNAKSLALIMDDPDAPLDTFTHWIVWNIDPTTTELKEGKIPEGAKQGTNDYNKIGYGGANPPDGIHRYSFRLLALKQKLSLNSRSTAEDFNNEIKNRVLATAELNAYYSKVR
jgi:hypothetical protein